MVGLATLFAQSDAGVAAAAGVGLFVILLYIAIIVLVVAGLWKMFTKAGHPGWAAIVPIYNLYILVTIAGKEWWWMLLMLVPCVSVIISLLVSLEIAKRFGKGTGFGIGLWLLAPIFFCILGFGSAQYQGGAKAS